VVGGDSTEVESSTNKSAKKVSKNQAGMAQQKVRYRGVFVDAVTRVSKKDVNERSVRHEAFKRLKKRTR
jgi:ABC-type transporter Mla subunit MlaD